MVKFDTKFNVEDIAKMVVCISKGNMKMGAIPSVSFPPILTCASCECHKKCYAVKVCRYSKSAKQSYERNWFIYQNDKTKFWREVKAALAVNRAFRFFVSGDIPDYGFLVSMCQAAKENEHCEILCFTKRWQWVNQYLDEFKELPQNLHLIMSQWRNFKTENPYHVPECHIVYKDGFTTMPDGDCYFCSGNCTECFCEHKGCFYLGKGEKVLIKEH